MIVQPAGRGRKLSNSAGRGFFSHSRLRFMSQRFVPSALESNLPNIKASVLQKRVNEWDVPDFRMNSFVVARTSGLFWRRGKINDIKESQGSVVCALSVDHLSGCVRIRARQPWQRKCR
jgi:hypothetical protein